MDRLGRPPYVRGRVIAEKTQQVIFEGGGIEAELEAERLNNESDGSERFHVAVEIAPGKWGRINTLGGLGGQR
jgi:hypothetical protein